MTSINIGMNVQRLAALLTEALALADVLDLPIAAIHIDEALAQIAAAPPIDVIEIIAVIAGPGEKLVPVSML